VVALEGIGIAGMSQFCAVMCREKGEDYDEDKAMVRAEAFETLPMNIVWEVFFCITRLSTTSVNHVLTFLSVANRELVKELVSG